MSRIAHLFRATKGSDALAAFMKRHVARADEVVAVEEALLSGRFARYAVRRLGGFGLGRFWSTVLHLLELTWLAEVFSAKPFVASLALQNVTLVLDAWIFGALEGLRRRARELGPGMDASALTSRWLTFASWLAIVTVVLSTGRAFAAWFDDRRTPSLLHLYAIVCMLRLAADGVLRTYYSGIFAHYRVYRPLWMPIVSPTLMVIGTLALWSVLRGYAFVASLAVSVVVTRSLLYVYTRRAYRLRRIPSPRWSLRLPSLTILRERAQRGNLRHLRDGFFAGIANTTGRVGSVVLVAAAIPSLTQHGVFEEDGASIEPFAFALHLAAPLLFLTSQWWLVFYHDWKRLEEEASAALARLLHWRLLATGAAVGAVAWALAALLILVFVPLEESWLTLGSLAIAMVGLAVWTALQLRGFARGEFLRQTASGLSMVVVVWIASSSSWLGTTSWYGALAIGPWIAVVLSLSFSRIQSAHAVGEVESMPVWVRALRALRGEVSVWIARVSTRPGRIAERIAERLGRRGAVVRLGNAIVWFERPPFTSRTAWLVEGGGTIQKLEGSTSGKGSALLDSTPLLRRPESAELSSIAETHRRLFPEGFVMHVGRPAPDAFVALPAVTRQAIWRDGVGALRGNRARSGWFVTTYAPQGAAEVLYVTKRPVPSREAAAWRATLGRHAWRVFLPDEGEIEGKSKLS